MRNLRNFGITFAVSLVILGIVALIAAQYVAGAVTAIFDGHEFDLNQILQPTETQPNSEAGSDDKFTRELNGESFTWLMVIYDKREDVFDDYYPSKSQIEKSEENGILGKDYRLVKAKTIALVHANVEKREYVVMSIPSITKVETSTGDYTLGDVYGIYGIEYLKDKISSMTGLEIDYYTVMNAVDLSALSSAIGEIQCEVPVDIGFNGSEYVTYVEPEETTESDSKKTEPKAESDDDETDEDEETESPETEPVIESEVGVSKNFKEQKKLHAVMLYSDYSDGIEQETVIINTFVASVLNNISSASDTSLQNMIRGLEKKMTTNIIAEDIVKSGDVIRAYSWLGKQYVVYPGRLVSASASKDAFYMPDVNEAMEFFYKYR
ncbi:MAG: hypothetical protein IJ389_02775 [Clostridia bacterium]|nr:hypothetical protein [Clostridia bacterium]